MLEKIETYSLPVRVRNFVDRGMLALGAMAFVSGLAGYLI